ncbi:Nucleolar Complex 2 protein [Lignoscripta atroalba]|nr:Nucleolar Complex 2 protein [Lignoscripta atroalba]
MRYAVGFSSDEVILLTIMEEMAEPPFMVIVVRKIMGDSRSLNKEHPLAKTCLRQLRCPIRAESWRLTDFLRLRKKFKSHTSRVTKIMAGRAKKSTKKFEKNHLKEAIDRRKEFGKIKQRQQIKTKRKARNASDYAKASDEDDKHQPPKSNGRATSKGDPMKDMSVDDFFQGGFQLPELKKGAKQLTKVKDIPSHIGKRKRALEGAKDNDGSGSEGSESAEENLVESDSEPGSEGEDTLDTHKGDLNALAEKDPEFYKYLKENDAELLEFAEDADLAEVDELSEAEEAPKKKRKKRKDMEQDVEGDVDETEVTLAVVQKWKTAMMGQYSLRAMREVVLAFRAAAHVNEEDGKEYKYSISDPEVYHQLLVIALNYVPHVLNHHLPVKESASGKVRLTTDSKKYRTLTPLLKSHGASVHHLLENLSDAPTLKLTLSCILPILPYLLSFKKLLKSLVKAIVGIWSDPSSAEATRVNAFLCIRRLAVISDPSLREAVLKTTYQGLVKGSRNTTIHTLPGINLMKNSAAELWGLDPNIGYTTGFTYIRQLAIHLRGSITQPTKDSYKAIYNWQYTHSLDFWSRVLSTHCSTSINPGLKKPTDSPLHPLIYPLVQITLGALRLIPTPTYFPLRFHLTRSLLRLSRSTNTYIPLAPSLIEVLSSPEMKKPPKASTLKPLDFNTSIRAPKSYIHTRIYQDGVGDEASELLAEFFGVWCKNIAFPELVIPPTVLLKRWLKEVSSPPARGQKASSSAQSSKNGRRGGNRNHKVNSSITLVIQKLDENAQWIEERRRKVDFAPSDRAGVESFLRDVDWGETPLGAFVVGMRKQKEERERVLEEGRRAEEGRRETEKKEGRGDEDDEDGMVEDEMSDDEVQDEEDGDESG